MRNVEKGCANVSVRVAEIKWPSVLGRPKIGNMRIGAGSTFCIENLAPMRKLPKRCMPLYGVYPFYMFVTYVGSEMVKCILCVILPHSGKLLSTHFYVYRFLCKKIT
jgi:hypothetical protein